MWGLGRVGVSGNGEGGDVGGVVGGGDVEDVGAGGKDSIHLRLGVKILLERKHAAAQLSIKGLRPDDVVADDDAGQAAVGAGLDEDEDIEAVRDFRVDDHSGGGGIGLDEGLPLGGNDEINVTRAQAGLSAQEAERGQEKESEQELDGCFHKLMSVTFGFGTPPAA